MAVEQTKMAGLFSNDGLIVLSGSKFDTALLGPPLSPPPPQLEDKRTSTTNYTQFTTAVINFVDIKNFQNPSDAIMKLQIEKEVEHKYSVINSRSIVFS